MIFRNMQRAGMRFVEGSKIYAEVSYRDENGVFVAVAHNETAVYGHMRRAEAIALRDALTEAVNSDYWERYPS